MVFHAFQVHVQVYGAQDLIVEFAGNGYGGFNILVNIVCQPVLAFKAVIGLPDFWSLFQ